jgi:hypothetical protein
MDSIATFTTTLLSWVCALGYFTLLSLFAIPYVLLALSIGLFNGAIDWTLSIVSYAIVIIKIILV